MTTQDLILNLEAAGLDAPQVEQYLAYGQAENTAQQLQLLSRHRAALLDRVHQMEKQIGCLDYLVYQIQREQTADQTNQIRREQKKEEVK